MRDLVGKVDRKQENHGIHRKSSIKWMNEGYGRM
jgi:hypothetical protein